MHYDYFVILISLLTAFSYAGTIAVSSYFSSDNASNLLYTDKSRQISDVLRSSWFKYVRWIGTWVAAVVIIFSCSIEAIEYGNHLPLAYLGFLVINYLIVAIRPDAKVLLIKGYPVIAIIMTVATGIYLYQYGLHHGIGIVLINSMHAYCAVSATIKHRRRMHLAQTTVRYATGNK